MQWLRHQPNVSLRHDGVHHNPKCDVVPHSGAPTAIQPHGQHRVECDVRSHDRRRSNRRVELLHPRQRDRGRCPCRNIAIRMDLAEADCVRSLVLESVERNRQSSRWRTSRKHSSIRRSSRQNGSVRRPISVDPLTTHVKCTMATLDSTELRETSGDVSGEWHRWKEATSESARGDHDQHVSLAHHHELAAEWHPGSL